jgi:cholesterol oxidase
MLSQPITSLTTHHDVIVVGSGYGGAIMASRLARAGREVTLFERGRERWPGDFPDRLLSGARDIQARTTSGRFGDPAALFDFRFGRDMSVLVGCGLGGTSLINANVALRPGNDVFADERWPAAMRGNRELLEPWFELAEIWLGSTPYPSTRPTPAKLAALETGALAIGENVRRPPINVTFDEGVSAGGVRQAACNDCGDCVAGCNVGAKNTVLMNYLPDAHRHGARIFCEIEVDSVVPSAPGAAGRWTIWYRTVGRGRERFDAPDQFVTADVVVLAAGTLGSTEILLRSKANGLTTSDRVGERFSGNGDVLGFGTDTTRVINGIGWGRRSGREPVGPTITGVIDLSDQRPPGTGLVIEEGSIPSVLGSIMPAALMVAEAATDTRGLLRKILDAVSSWTSRAKRTIVYLVMSADDAHGRLSLDDGDLAISWAGAGSEGAIVDDNDVLGDVTTALGGRYLPDPLWTKEGGNSLITVHPLGGCVMADDATDGVVDDVGRVFSSAQGADVHDGLVVCDGSIIPRPLDVNPLLTISALAERAASSIAAERGWTFETAPDRTPAATPSNEVDRIGIRFTERMAGWFRLGATEYEAGERAGKSVGSTMDFVLTLDVSDLAATVADAATVQRTSGTVTAPALSPEVLAVEDGRFQIMAPVPEQVDTWHMVYTMALVATDGRRYRFAGHKVIHEGPIWRAWNATTTLFVDITDDVDGRHIGSGILHIGVTDLLRQLSTSKVQGTTRLPAQLAAKVRFGRAFLGDIMRVYGGPIDEFGRLDPAAPTLRPMRLPAPTTTWFDGSDWHDDQPGGTAQLKLTNYTGGTKGPIMLASGFSMAASSYAVPTTETTLTEHLVERGYDVWLFDYRASIELPSCRTDFTIDDIAREDWPNAVAEVRRRTGADSVQVLGHCVGSVSILMALLSGLEGVRSVVCSQFTTQPVTGWLNRLKNRLHIGSLMALVGLRGLAPDTGRGVFDAVADMALGLIPRPKGEQCSQPMCRWLNAIFGLTHTHSQLNDDTHRAFPTLFGYGEVRPINQLAVMTQRNRAVDIDGNDTYCNHPDRLALPILFLQGDRNYIFLPEGTKRTVSWLSGHNDPSLYTYTELPGYAHLDALIGRNADRDVYPHIVEHLDRFNASVG